MLQQSLNALLSNCLTLRGMFIDDNFLQPPKANFPILVTELGIITFVRLPH